jgi:hypothetical protein
MNDVAGNKLTDAEIERHVETFHSRLGAIRTEVRKIIVGQDDVVDHLLLTLLVGGRMSRAPTSSKRTSRPAIVAGHSYPVRSSPTCCSPTK